MRSSRLLWQLGRGELNGDFERRRSPSSRGGASEEDGRKAYTSNGAGRTRRGENGDAKTTIGHDGSYQQARGDYSAAGKGCTGCRSHSKIATCPSPLRPTKNYGS